MLAPWPARLALAAWLLSATLPAAAEPRLAVDPPGSLVAGDPSWVAPSPGGRGDRLLRVMLLADYARAPLVLVSPNQNRQPVVEEQLWLRLAAAFSLHHRWLLGLEVPLLLRERGEASSVTAALPRAAEQAALGDPNLTLRGRVLGHADGFALGLGARVSLPLATQTYAGHPGPVLGAFAAAGHQDATSFSAFTLGFAYRENQTLPGIVPTRIGSTVRLALAGGVTLDRARALRLGPELALSTTVSNGARLLDPRSSVGELLVHLQYRILGGPFELGFGLGPCVGGAPGAADYRALLGVVFSPEEPAPPPDADDDRVPDDNDMCPSLSGEPSEDPMMHGCPAVPSDADGDGIPDTLDACPRTAGEASLMKRRHGCPKPSDRDRDGIADPDDACPDVPGVESDDDRQRGCAAPKPKVELKQAEIAISEQVQFETGTALIRDDSSALLQQVADVLKSHPEIESCEVAGHSDDTGTIELNRQLSEARARAVMAWLVAHGVDSRRLSARGYGQSRPSADNTTEEGRARNRRVEFLITRRAVPAPQEPAP